MSFLSKWVPGMESRSPDATTQISWTCEGLPGGWALLLLLALILATWWSYRVWATGLTPGRRTILVVLRSLFFAVLVCVLAHPVLLITMEEPIRGALLVLLDNSQSMNFEDKREAVEDQHRAALASGRDDGRSAAISRWKLLQQLAGNEKMRLWPRLQEKAELVFFSVGSDVQEIGALGGRDGKPLSVEESAAFFNRLTAGANATALGDGMQKIIDDYRGKLVSGILLITDGANNSGIPPVQVAQQAAREKIPVYIYGVGVTSPRDIIVSELTGPKTSRLKERADFTVKIRSVSFSGKMAILILKANGQKVDEKNVEFARDSVQEVNMGYTPSVAEEVRLEASIAPMAEEMSAENNAMSMTFRVTDEKTPILIVEQEPRWDFEYLVATLQRDQSVLLKAVLLDGDAKLAGDPVFTTTLPDSKEELFANKVIILGDVDPSRLGEAWMKKVVEWVGEMGGGLVVHGGPKFNPRAYRGTPLAGILPVNIVSESSAPERRPMDLVDLNLTSVGQVASILKLVDNVDENRTLWRKFPGVRWIAPVDASKPAAEVLIRAGSRNLPILAIQNYGSGQVLFMGTDETYRWRSKTGEKYYAKIWGQILRLMASGQEESGKVRLKVERPQYATGERVIISGRIFRSGYVPLTDATVSAKFVAQSGVASTPEQKGDITLRAIPDQPGEYRAEFLAGAPGVYRLVTALDPKTSVQWEVSRLNLEQSETSMNELLLKEMAAAAGGTFLREENLEELPKRVAANGATESSMRKIDLALFPIVLGVLLILLVGEWILRRVWQLK